MKNAIELAKNGNNRAIAYLYNKYYKVVYNTLLYIVKDKNIATDLTSEVFIKAFNSLDKFYVNISFEMWLKTIANNKGIDFIRNTKHFLNDSIDNETSLFSLSYTDNSTPEDDLIKQEEIELLRKAIDRLPSKYRDLINLRINDNLSYTEIAKRKKISLNLVKSHLHKAKTRIINQLSNF